MADYYKILGIFPDATQVQVWRAIRRYQARQVRKSSVHRALVERAARVLGDPQLRATYDRVYGYDLNYEIQQRFWAKDRQLEACQQQKYQLENELKWLRTQRLEVSILQQELIKCRQQKERLEVAQKQWDDRQASEQARRVKPIETPGEEQLSKARLLTYLAAALLALALPKVVRSLFTSDGPSLEAAFGQPYQPVAAGVRWGTVPDSTVQQQVELMPQFRGGAAGLRDYLREQVLSQLPPIQAKPLLATGQLSFVVDSTGRVGTVHVLSAPDSTSRQLLLALGRHLPRFIPGYQEAKPTSVRLAVKLAH